MRVSDLPVVFVMIMALFGTPMTVSAQPAPAEQLVEQYLRSGRLAEGEEALTEHLKANANDDQARFGLGTIQFLRGVERLMQSLYAYGLGNNEDRFGGGLPFARLPVPPNPDPKTISYDDCREIASAWVKDLATAEATLAQVKSADVKLPLKIGLVRLDFNGDGAAADDETLWKIFARVQNIRDAAATQPGGEMAQQAEQFVIAFDAGDVQWLRGYCHLLMALGDMMLAHDERELFESTAHLFFPKVESPYLYLGEGRKVADMGMGFDIADAIAFIHLIRFPVVEPQRMQSAHAHLTEMLQRSRASWELILAETDDDREWIPNAKQQTVLPNVRVSQEMIQSWLQFLDEAEALMAGKRLAPFWRGAEEQRGVNLRRVFIEPRPLDLVLWVQGSAAAPYLEKGELTRPDVWQNMARAFRGNLFGFAVWFN